MDLYQGDRAAKQQLAKQPGLWGILIDVRRGQLEAQFGQSVSRDLAEASLANEQDE